MNTFIKNLLIGVGLYHPLQSAYRRIVFSAQNKKYRRQYQRYAGTGYTCNVCNAVYSRFVPDYPAAENKIAIDKNKVVAGYGENVFCPNCMSTARERLVIAFLKEEINLRGKHILHVSPEKNVYDFIKTSATVTTADLLPGFYKTIDGMVQKQDATQFSFAANSFDLVIANHILEHIPTDKKAMREIFRVMKPGATAILQVPYSEIIAATLEDPLIQNPARQSLLYGQKDHVRIYALNEYVRRLEEAGFHVEIYGPGELAKFAAYAIQPNEKFLRLKKQASTNNAGSTL